MEARSKKNFIFFFLYFFEQLNDALKVQSFYVCFVQRCSDELINSQDYKSFDIYVVTMKISMTEYHHLINRQTNGLF